MGEKDGDEKEKKELVFNDYEIFVTDFLSKISMISLAVLVCMSIAIVNLISCAQSNDIKNVQFTCNQCFMVLGVITAITLCVMLVAPVIYQSMIYICEGVPDKKMKMKRSVNQIALGLFLLTAVFLMILVPAMFHNNFAKGPVFIFFVLALLVDLVLVHYSMVSEKNSPFRVFITISSVTGIAFLISTFSSIGFSPMVLIVAILAKTAIIESTYFVKQLRTTEDGRKKNVRILNFLIVLAVYSILFYCVFQNDINEYINSVNDNLANYLYGFLHKFVIENPFGIAKIMKGGGK
ncbi:putative transporter [Trachipleistophora hominis]|uniref:Putative transporter n=1 Tax=Trachipleistophora hominis TaxID=72359 RepID=L7JU51_TRAHO|nr:putative transporter [Trachipleistophora hominis]